MRLSGKDFRSGVPRAPDRCSGQTGYRQVLRADEADGAAVRADPLLVSEVGAISDTGYAALNFDSGHSSRRYSSGFVFARLTWGTSAAGG